MRRKCLKAFCPIMNALSIDRLHAYIPWLYCRKQLIVEHLEKYNLIYNKRDEWYINCYCKKNNSGGSVVPNTPSWCRVVSNSCLSCSGSSKTRRGKPAIQLYLMTRTILSWRSFDKLPCSARLIRPRDCSSGTFYPKYQTRNPREKWK